MSFVLGAAFPPARMDVSADSIRQFAAASYDFNPLHLDPNWMSETRFGKTQFKTVIAHGLMTYALLTRMVTDAVYPLGGWHERLEARFKSPVYPGDRITATGTVLELKPLGDQLVYVASVTAHNQDGVLIAEGEAMGRVPA
jgi:acyl dehydratase